MTTLVFASIFASIIIINVLISFQERKQTANYYMLYNAERTKSFFAKARNEMMCMVVENKIDSKSDYFKSIYHLHTFIMRNPDAYADFSKELTKTLLNIKSTEGKALTESEKRISYLTAEALGHIVVNYSGLMRFLFALTKKLENEMDRAKFIGLLAHLGKMDSKIKAEREIKKTQSEFYKISDNHLMPC